MSDTRVVAVLGAGALGAAMAARLGETEHEVRLWNRTAERARAAAANSTAITAVERAGDAVHDAAAVITVLRDGDAVASVMEQVIGRCATARSGCRPAPSARAAHARSPISRPPIASHTSTRRCPAAPTRTRGKARVARRRGGRGAAQRAGVLDALGSSVLHVGTGVEGSSLKLAVNAWMTAATVAMSDVLALCDTLGIDHATFTGRWRPGRSPCRMNCRRWN